VANTVASGTITLVPVDETNVEQVLAVRVSDEQYEFVSRPAELLDACAGDEPPAQVIAFESDGKIVGLCAWMRSEANALWLSNFQVDERCQGRGFGRQAIAALARFAADDGMVAVDLTYHPWNEPAKRLYRRCGFVDMLALPQVRLARLAI
jgi:diamine N-acetyltransferase